MIAPFRKKTLRASMAQATLSKLPFITTRREGKGLVGRGFGDSPSRHWVKPARDVTILRRSGACHCS